MPGLVTRGGLMGSWSCFGEKLVSGEDGLI